MKIISVIRADIIEAFDGPTEVMTPEVVESAMAPVFENKLRILQSFFTIEHVIDSSITCYFLGVQPAPSARREEFIALVLQSGHLAFHAKRSLIRHIVDDLQILQPKEKQGYDKALKDVGSYRNAFAHGIASTDGRRVKLRYFEGSPQERFLDDDYFHKVERVFNYCYHVTEIVKLAVYARGKTDPNKAVDPTPGTALRNAGGSSEG